MRLLVDARPVVDAKGGGVGRVARHLLEAFVRLAADDEIVLATTGSRPPSPDALPTGPNVRSIHVHIPNKLWSLACMTGFAALDEELGRRAGNIDATFLPNLGFVGDLKRPHVLLLHDLSFLLEPAWFPPKARWWHRAVDAASQIRRATHLLAVSETTKHDAMRLLDIPRDRITVIPLGSTILPHPVVPAQAGTPPEGFPLPASAGTGLASGLRGNDRGRYVLALGANDPRKNASTAIEAVAALRREPGFEDIELKLVGRDGPISDEDLADLYRHASAFLYPSWYEGFGLPLHEAAAFGTPCIASTAGALPETAPPGTLFADPAKPHHWVEALKIVLSASTSGERSGMPIPLFLAQPWDKAASILLEALRGVTH
ncbi:MAG: glycosyltransferase family 1 protein [Patescibacteria group bacterium]